MFAVLKKLTLGLVLIAASAAILLYSDLDSRKGAAETNAGRPLKVAIVQQTSIPALDDGVTGALETLKQRGYADGGRMLLRRYNAQGDISTGNAIAKEVTSGEFDLIFSFSTVSLQTIANANRFATPPRRHVFALVSDPYAVGVGVSAENHAVHPPYMTGVGSLAPVEEAFVLAKQLRPSLKSVGLVWDPSEANSVVTTKLARAVCAKMGITLVEANAENSTMISDGVASLLSRGAEAIWVSPDLIASHGLDLIVSKAKTGGIPVFTSIPRSGGSGALFELGANYMEIGHVAGNLAADVLDGRDTAKISVENVVPVVLNVNRLALKGLKETWELPDSVLQRADLVVDETGRHVKGATASAQSAANQPPASEAAKSK
ncbi:MAG TPA: ABC transporter substrate-binding protein [Terracidiphilus sp.]|nr:ABC transporter substrate-binding protein [Terracidiphilus sp.]